MICSLPWFLFPFENSWLGGGGVGGCRPTPTYPFILQNCVKHVSASQKYLNCISGQNTFRQFLARFSQYDWFLDVFQDCFQHLEKR